MNYLVIEVLVKVKLVNLVANMVKDDEFIVDDFLQVMVVQVYLMNMNDDRNEYDDEFDVEITILTKEKMMTDKVTHKVKMVNPTVRMRFIKIIQRLIQIQHHAWVTMMMMVIKIINYISLSDQEYHNFAIFFSYV